MRYWWVYMYQYSLKMISSSQVEKLTRTKSTERRISLVFFNVRSCPALRRCGPSWAAATWDISTTKFASRLIKIIQHKAEKTFNNGSPYSGSKFRNEIRNPTTYKYKYKYTQYLTITYYIFQKNIKHDLCKKDDVNH